MIYLKSIFNDLNEAFSNAFLAGAIQTPGQIGPHRSMTFLLLLTRCCAHIKVYTNFATEMISYVA